MVMVSNQSNLVFGCLAGRHPGKIGHLYSPGGARSPVKWIPHALDNGAYSAFLAGTDFDVDAWFKHLRWAAAQASPPLWAAVPDKVGDPIKTLSLWHRFHTKVRLFGFRPAFVVQDGMTFNDVPDATCVLFIGGSTEWKESVIEPWCNRFPGRVHVGRVNAHDRLWKCHRAGAVSVDGTGWWHKERQMPTLIEYCERTAT